ncbi:MAG: glutamine synthetase [Parcubacteria group bacterium RIFCSPHIGHO2_02_FULL_48_10b]|nr:MAG: glutamine synthetase [Parcubacteria group bacterium RIFCSPHIGHO2_02_FULL_48_10b]
MKIRAEYIWIDGQKPTAKMRSKTKILDVKDIPASSDDVPRWGFDGSSTSQATTDASDLDLVPVFAIPDPIRGAPNILVLCEVYHPDGRPHESNTRAVLRKSLKKYQKQYEPWFGFEQEYTLYDKDGIWPLRWPQGGGYPAPQGGYYCGVGSDEVFGTELIEAHTLALLDAGLAIAGTNAEVMASQWEFQIGGPNATASTAADHLWLARWILYRLGEHFGITVKLDPKPIVGDWNGAGCHTNFSTNSMREENGLDAIFKACEKLKGFHKEHIWVYGAHNDERLTGAHETCPITDFRYAMGHRGCSIRIPAGVAKNRRGYLEDRRPAANIDPYQVCTAILETVCGKRFNPGAFRYFYDEKHRRMMRGLFD